MPSCVYRWDFGPCSSCNFRLLCLFSLLWKFVVAHVTGSPVACHGVFSPVQSTPRGVGAPPFCKFSFSVHHPNCSALSYCRCVPFICHSFVYTCRGWLTICRLRSIPHWCLWPIWRPKLLLALYSRQGCLPIFRLRIIPQWFLWPIWRPQFLLVLYPLGMDD